MRIVDFGSDLGWGELTYRGKSAERARLDSVDHDGDGSTANDYVSCWPFSLEEPLNPPGLRYETDQKSAIFYGGLTLYSSNPANPAKPRSISEGHLNANHEFRDDLNFMGGLEDHGAKELVEAYGVWFWQKKDFLNGGDRRRVRFDAGSRIQVHVSRYWGGLHAGRWMVRDGDDFYLSKKTWGDLYQAFAFDAKAKGPEAVNPIVHTTHSLQPESTEWALYRPQAPHQIEFDHTKAEFKPHQFQHVTAVGVFVNRDRSPPVKVAGGLRPPFALKWNAFRCDAVVERTADDALVATLAVPGADGKPAFRLGRSEVSFAQWQKVWRISVGNQYGSDVGDLGYSFDRDGAMGSMRADQAAHTPSEPVTDIHWADAVTFCNALSEMEGLTPAYYADAAFTQPYRRPVDRTQRENWHHHATVYWKKDAAGYRLPTADEWRLAAGRTTKGWVKSNADERTHEVASSHPDAQGFFDLMGNVWEYVWSGDSSVDCDREGRVVALGGSYDYPAPPEAHNPTPFAVHPWRGHFATGFRVARNAGSTFVPVEASVEVPTWVIAREQAVPPKNAMTREALAALLRERLDLVETSAGLANACEEMDPEVVREKNKQVALAQNNRFLGKISVEESEALITANTIDRQRTPYPLSIGRTEVPYALWKLVQGWAENNGYRFNFSGDMGSMRHATDRTYTYRPEEPVTQISWYDAITWCNAASEIMGKTPVFYSDAAFQQVYRTSLWFRLEMFPYPGSPNLPWATNLRKGAIRHSGSGDRVYFNSAADGFRLPLDIEFQAAARQPTEADLTQEWTAPQAQNKTQAVGTKAGYANGLCDANGNVFEWGWDSERINFEAQNADYRLNGNGYFYEPYEATRPRSEVKRHAYSEYTGVARSFVGFRIATRTGVKKKP